MHNDDFLRVIFFDFFPKKTWQIVQIDFVLVEIDLPVLVDADEDVVGVVALGAGGIRQVDFDARVGDEAGGDQNENQQKHYDVGERDECHGGDSFFLESHLSLKLPDYLVGFFLQIDGFVVDFVQK